MWVFTTLLLSHNRLHRRDIIYTDDPQDHQLRPSSSFCHLNLPQSAFMQFFTSKANYVCSMLCELCIKYADQYTLAAFFGAECQYRCYQTPEIISKASC